MSDESIFSSTVTIGDSTDKNTVPRREPMQALDVREAVRGMAAKAMPSTSSFEQLDSGAVWADGRRQPLWSDRSLVVFGGGLGIVAVIVLVLSVVTVSDDSTHRPLPAPSSVAPSRTAPTTAAAPTLVTTVPSPSALPPPSTAPPPAIPATSTLPAPPAETTSTEPAPARGPDFVVPRRLHRLFPHLFPDN